MRVKYSLLLAMMYDRPKSGIIKRSENYYAFGVLAPFISDLNCDASCAVVLARQKHNGCFSVASGRVVSCETRLNTKKSMNLIARIAISRSCEEFLLEGSRKDCRMNFGPAQIAGLSVYSTGEGEATFEVLVTIFIEHDLKFLKDLIVNNRSPAKHKYTGELFAVPPEANSRWKALNSARCLDKSFKAGTSLYGPATAVCSLVVKSKEPRIEPFNNREIVLISRPYGPAWIIFDLPKAKKGRYGKKKRGRKARGRIVNFLSYGQNGCSTIAFISVCEI